MSVKRPAYIGRSRLPRDAYAAFRLLMHAIEIEARDDPTLWEDVPAGVLDRAYLRRLGEALLAKARIGSAARAREELRKFADQIEAGRGRHFAGGYHPKFAKSFAAAVRVFALWLRPPMKRGGGGSNKGEFGYARELAAEALTFFTHEANVRGNPAMVPWLREAGLDGGRRAVAKQMLRVDEKFGRCELTFSEALAAIRDEIKAEKRSR